MSDKEQQTHVIYYGEDLVGASPIARTRAVSSVIREWKKSLGGGPEFVEHKGAAIEEPVLTVKGALPGELLGASLNGFKHRKVDATPAPAA